MNLRIPFNSLLVQMIAVFIAMVILTSATVGIPSIWLLQNQLDRQAWSQVEQGRQVTIALFDSYYKEILSLATLTAQRPTLQDLIIQADSSLLKDYLTTLQIGAELDRIVICDIGDQIIASTDIKIPTTSCTNWKAGKYQLDQSIHQVCLTAHQPIENATVVLGEAFVSRCMDNKYAVQLRDQTGLEHILWQDDIPLSTSLNGGLNTLNRIVSQDKSSDLDGSKRLFEIEGISYYATQIPLNNDNLKAEIALDITEIKETRIRLVGYSITSILGVSAIGSVLGILVARRINRPLDLLSESASSFSQGLLNAPVNIDTPVREITQVADALESARVDLLTTMMSLQSERDWSDRLLASIVEGIITLDGENKITFFSDGAERITGWSKTKVIGHLIDDVFMLVDADESFSNLIPAMPSGRQKFDVKIADNRIVSLAFTSAQLSRSGQKEKEIAFVFRDISEEEAVHRLLGHFLANVAHEFLTPLSALEASIELLLDQTPDLSPGELNELHTSLHLGILGLHNLVINLLESANIEARRFRISPRTTDLGNIISDAVQTIQPLLIKYEQRLTLQLPLEIPSIRADARRTVQVLTNLLSNASRYGPPGEEITLCVTTKKENVHIAVIDRGPGIPPEHRSNIFRRFVFPQADDAISKEGAGLGLSVVKAIVTAQNGQVGVEENPGGGSIFWFTLPIVKEGL